MPTQAGLKQVRVSTMNAVQDLAVLVARDEGLFQEEGLDLEVVNVPGQAQGGRNGDLHRRGNRWLYPAPNVVPDT